MLKIFYDKLLRVSVIRHRNNTSLIDNIRAYTHINSRIFITRTKRPSLTKLIDIRYPFYFFHKMT